MAKIEAGQMVVSPPVHLPELIQRLVDRLLPRANAKGLVLTFRLDEVVPTYGQSDRGKLQQILPNLLDNALKFTEVGTVHLAIELVNPDCCGANFPDVEGHYVAHPMPAAEITQRLAQLRYRPGLTEKVTVFNPNAKENRRDFEKGRCTHLPS